jgi:undecaprenyl phosphate N,N'-diacetylbacillosamine 1-phosphate transferase
MSRKIQLFIKRLFDLVVCSILLICGLPLLFLLALIVKFTSKGPVFFIQERIGRNGKPYKILKFRTMTGLPDQNEKKWTKSEEERITSVGHFLRDYGLDELPQLINIIKGDMSIIGPRTPLPQQGMSLSVIQKKMFEMRPGVISLAAIAGRRSLTMERRYDLHAEYVEKWTLILDIKILWQSFFVILRRESTRDNLTGE